jgi:hypothetical protein
LHHHGWHLHEEENINFNSFEYKLILLL